jgi:hypothetical protein
MLLPHNLRANTLRTAKRFINHEVLQASIHAIDMPNKGLQNLLQNECSTKYLTKLWALEGHNLVFKDR